MSTGVTGDSIESRLATLEARFVAYERSIARMQEDSERCFREMLERVGAVDARWAPEQDVFEEVVDNLSDLRHQFEVLHGFTHSNIANPKRRWSR